MRLLTMKFPVSVGLVTSSKIENAIVEGDLLISVCERGREDNAMSEEMAHKGANCFSTTRGESYQQQQSPVQAQSLVHS